MQHQPIQSPKTLNPDTTTTSTRTPKYHKIHTKQTKNNQPNTLKQNHHPPNHQTPFPGNYNEQRGAISFHQIRSTDIKNQQRSQQDWNGSESIKGGTEEGKARALPFGVWRSGRAARRVGGGRTIRKPSYRDIGLLLPWQSAWAAVGLFVVLRRGLSKCRTLGLDGPSWLKLRPI